MPVRVVRELESRGFKRGRLEGMRADEGSKGDAYTFEVEGEEGAEIRFQCSAWEGGRWEAAIFDNGVRVGTLASGRDPSNTFREEAFPALVDALEALEDGAGIFELAGGDVSVADRRDSEEALEELLKWVTAAERRLGRIRETIAGVREGGFRGAVSGKSVASQVKVVKNIMGSASDAAHKLQSSGWEVRV